MGFTRMRLLNIAYLNIFLLYFIWHFSLILAEDSEEPVTRSPVKLSAILRNISESFNPSTKREDLIETTTKVPFRRRVNVRIKSLRREPNQRRVNSSLLLKPNPNRDEISESFIKSESARQPKSLSPIVSKISGVVKGGKQNPQDLIRNALINHTLEHAGEQDLDKLVFSNLPNGSKLVLRTVRIIRTDEDGNPMDDSEHAQPTYWDVTLGNATAHDKDAEEESESESEESEEDISGSETNATEPATGRSISTPVALTSADSKVVVVGRRKRPDLESSGSHAAANYHHLNDYGTVGRDKEHGTTHFHGNTHGNTHKNTYTETDGKDVKPYHGTEKGLTDYANDHGKSNKDQGERFKTSKRKNKGRKVTGFKRVYHKEEYQRTEHFYDDEEAKKIAESFGLSEAKAADNHGTKGDKRKYQGVRTDYLDGKKHENEHGTHDGYNKGQHTTYKDSEKHSHQGNYGKSQSHGSAPQQHNHHGYDDYQQNHHNNHHQQQQQHVDYHPNHNYDASYSNPKKSTISQVPKSLIDQLGGSGGGGSRSIASIISAPMAHSFSVTEYAPLVAESIATSDPRKTAMLHVFDASGFEKGNLTNPLLDYNTDITGPNQNQTTTNDEYGYRERKKPLRKRPRQRKMYFSPKHRPVQEDAIVQNLNNNYKHNSNDDVQLTHSFPPIQPVPIPALSYQVSSVSDIINRPENNQNSGRQAVIGENETQYTPYAPNFGPPSSDSQYVIAPHHNYNRENSGQHYPKTWRWPPPHHHRRQNKRPRPVAYTPLQMQLLTQKASGYPRLMDQRHLAGIPLRHASAYHRLGNRHHRYQTLRHHPKRHHYEISTRKSDTMVNDDDNATYSDIDNNSAHYFNHNQRYAKNHLTSTINPLQNNRNNNGVRNTLIDPTPGTYSTVIKVLPATMLNVSDSATHYSGLNHHNIDGNNAAKELGGHLSAVTQRPLTQADTISITTEYPPHHLQSSSQQHHLRPFLPKKRWLTFTLNLGNPDFKLGNEYGPGQHPFGQNSQKASRIMQGIKNGLLKPFGRGSRTQAASPTVISPQQKPIFHDRAPLFQDNSQQILMLKRPRHPIFAHNVVSYGKFGEQMQTSPSLIAVKSEPPKFYYNYRPNEENQNVTSRDDNPGQEVVVESRALNKESLSPKPTLKVAQTVAILPTGPSSTVATTTIKLPLAKEPEFREPEKQPTQPPPFINGIMDSVADFFGRMG